MDERTEEERRETLRGIAEFCVDRQGRPATPEERRRWVERMLRPSADDIAPCATPRLLAPTHQPRSWLP